MIMKKSFLIYCFVGIMPFLIVACISLEGKDGTAETTNGILLDSGTVLAEKLPKSAVDTADMPVFEFDKMEHNFGTIQEGEKITFTYKFKNIGKTPLIIEDAKVTCGCTKPEYPKSAIEPGDGGTITVTFDSNNKRGKMQKPIIIVANTKEASTALYLSGTVEGVDESMGPVRKN